MDWKALTTDDLEQRLITCETIVSGARRVQIEILEELDSRQVATGDGSRSLAEWVAARLDVNRDTARCLTRTMRRTTDRPDLRVALADGVSFDRVEAVSRIPDDV
ncbi:MAG: hypothetical protein L0Z63_08855, partial [Actinobacteria bacterium]|nr:hypothetical protein [Actinomycetota bacterium]